jgi:hypothetical protein
MDGIDPSASRIFGLPRPSHSAQAQCRTNAMTISTIISCQMAGQASQGVSRNLKSNAHATLTAASRIIASATASSLPSSSKSRPTGLQAERFRPVGDRRGVRSRR